MSIPFHSIKSGNKRPLDLHDVLVSDEEATYFVRIKSDRFSDLNVYDGDILIIDRSRIRHPHQLFVIIADGEFDLVPRAAMPQDCELWGAVTYVIHKS